MVRGEPSTAGLTPGRARPSPGLSRDGLAGDAVWPLRLLYLGFPLWWVLGLSTFVFPLLAVPMAVRLLCRRTLVVPRGFGLWLLFLLWVAVGVLMVELEAPGSVGGHGGAGRYLTWGYRLVLYLAVTVVLLYVCNHTERELPTRTIGRLLAFMFVVTTLGGVLGVLAPHLELRSALELAAPDALSRNAYFTSLTHPRAAEIQTVLGYPAARPVAPFTYANTWGSNYSFFLPFFLITWFGRDAGWRRYVGPWILLVSAVPIVYSLNRGLWGALAVGLAYVTARMALQGRVWALQGIVAAVVLAAAVVVFSPLGSTVQERLAHPHSNERRAQLLSLSVTSAARGSPVLGFGTTRNVQGSFASIAGGETARCRGCGVPPLGTQGQLWAITFYQGLVGAALFLLFFLARFLRHARSTWPYAIGGTCILVMAATEMFVYDFSGSALTTIMIAVALMWRHDREAAQT